MRHAGSLKGKTPLEDGGKGSTTSLRATEMEIRLVVTTIRI